MTEINDDYIVSLFYGVRQLKSVTVKKYSDRSKLFNELDLCIYDYIHNRYSDSESLKETLYRMKHHLDIRPVCIVCSKKLTVTQIISGHTHCCCRCSQLDPDVRKKNENTNLRLYGVRNGYQSQQAKDKYINTCLQRIGRPNYFSGKDGVELAANGMLKKHGKRNAQQVKDFNIKSQDTLEIRTGKRFTSQVREIRLKSQKRYVYKDLKFDSGLELKYFIYLVDHKIPFVRNPDITFEYITHDKKKHVYFPDYLVDGILVELKGDHFFDKETGKMINPYDRSQDDNYECKYQCMLKNGVIILKESQCKYIFDYIDSKYGKGFVKQFKK